MKDASHVKIGVFRAKIPTCRGPEQDNGFEIRPRKFLQPPDQFRQFRFRRKHFASVPFCQRYQPPEAPPPPLLPPPNPPNPPPPALPPPPKPPPPQPPFERLPALSASIPSRNQRKPLPPDPSPRDPRPPRPDRLPITRKKIIRPRMTQNTGNPIFPLPF